MVQIFYKLTNLFSIWSMDQKEFSEVYWAISNVSI